MFRIVVGMWGYRRSAVIDGRILTRAAHSPETRSRAGQEGEHEYNCRMPSLVLYIDETDAKQLLDALNRDPEIAFIVSHGPGSWIAKKDY